MVSFPLFVPQTEVAMTMDGGCHGYGQRLPWLWMEVPMVMDGGCHGYGLDPDQEGHSRSSRGQQSEARLVLNS